MKKVLSVLLCLFVCLSLTGCGSDAKEKVFSDNGFTITLNENFSKKELVSVTNYYESLTAIVTATKDEIANLATLNITTDSTLEDYANLVLVNNNKESELHKSENGKYVYFTYTAESSGKEFYYVSAVYKASDAFWLVNFACVVEDKDEFHDQFIEWANSVEV